jgi:hypothetical protein
MSTYKERAGFIVTLTDHGETYLKNKKGLLMANLVASP